MSYIHPAALEHLRRRWQRADAYRFAAPGTPEAKMPGYLHPWAAVAREEQAAADEARARAAVEQDEFEREVLRLRADHDRVRRMLAEVKYELAWRRLVRKYSPDQPRVPAGSGRESGRWTDSSGSGAGHNDGRSTRNAGQAGQEARLHEEDAAARPKGHHYVNQSLYKDLPLPAETRKVFDEATTGPISAERHGWSEQHDQYNRAVKESFDKFIQKNGIQPERMTPDQARSFVQEVIQSSDPRIRPFNMRMLIREFLYRPPRFFRNNE